MPVHSKFYKNRSTRVIFLKNKLAAEMQCEMIGVISDIRLLPQFYMCTLILNGSSMMHAKCVVLMTTFLKIAPSSGDSQAHLMRIYIACQD